MILNLASILQPLDWSTVFSRYAPIEIDLGSGDGSFLFEYAKYHTELNLLGVERLLGRLRKTEKKCRRAGLDHVRLLRLEASYFVEYMVPPHSIAAIHLYFPDPWPKRKHWKHRLINESFARHAARVLAPHGVIHLRTDDAPYFAQMQNVFAGNPSFRPHTPPADLVAIQTDFERTFHARGISTLRASYALAPPPFAK